TNARTYSLKEKERYSTLSRFAARCVASAAGLSAQIGQGRVHWSDTDALDARNTDRRGLLECRLGRRRVPRCRAAHERLSHSRACRLRVWLHAGEWANPRCARAVFVLDRCDRLASSL